MSRLLPSAFTSFPQQSRPALESLLDSRLERWSRFHAAGMLVSTGVASAFAELRVVVAFATFSLAILVAVGRGSWSNQRSFGWGNWVTTLRLSFVLLLPFCLRQAPPQAWGALGLAIFLLDGLDGWLARLTHSASDFGAHFDMETDAVFICVMTQALWQRSILGTWILAPGLLRYVYVLFNSVVNDGASEPPRTLSGRVAYSCLVAGLTGAFLLPQRWALFTGVAGTSIVSLSFLRSFMWSWSRRVINPSRPG